MKRTLTVDTLVVQAGCSFTVDGSIYREDKYDMVLAMKELVCRGMASEVVEEINAMDPNFFVQNPDLLFQLKQVSNLLVISLDWPQERFLSGLLG